MALALVWSGALSLGAALFGRYRDVRRLQAVGLGAGAISGLAAAVAAIALYAYGVAASPDAVLVWRAAPLRALPVDTPAETAPVQLPAGAAAHAERAFLGWWRLRFADGRAGWVRRENLIWLWPRSDD
jgi:hypothetical protein